MDRKTILITGASMGIGREIAAVLSRNGVNLIINYFKHKDQADLIAREINKGDSRAIVFKADVSDRKQVAQMFEESRKVFGKVDIVINNAGVAQQKLFTDISEEDWDRMFNINVKGAYNCIHEALPDMIRAKRGKIINMSSIWGLVGASCEVHYSASKAAIIGLTKALAKEVGPSGIQVNCVAPGVIMTDMVSNFSPQDIKMLEDETPLGRVGTPTDIANVVEFLVSEKSDFITGQVISPNGGFVI